MKVYKHVIISVVLLVVLLSFSAVPVFTESPQNPFVDVSQDSVQASSLVSRYPPKISVVEKITDNLNGTWTYSYQICFNVESENIWQFAVYTRFDYNTTTVGNPTKFNGHPSWLISSNLKIPESVAIVYDARNIDPSITALQGITTKTWPGPPLVEPIVPGERASGFSFRANVYDPNPKVFCYDVEGHWAPQDPEGKVAAWGWTDTICHYGEAPVGGELLVPSEPQNAVSKYGLLFSAVLIAPAATIFYLEKKKRRK